MHGDAEAAIHGRHDIKSANTRRYVSHDADMLTWLGHALVLLEHLEDAEFRASMR